MNFIRKFYNTDVAEPAGGTEVKTEVPKEDMSVAAAMAKFGKKSDENSTAPKPIDINAKAEVKTEPTPAAPAKVEEPVKTEPKAQVLAEEPKKTEPAPIVQPASKAPTLEEVLKKEQPNTILKALGLDDDRIGLVNDLKEIDPKLVGIIQAWKNGTLGDYVRELSTDYGKMTAEEVMRHQLRREYPKASEKALQALYESEVVERFKLDPESYSETEVEKGRLLLEAKADRYRDEFTANQDKYLLPSKPEPKKQEPAPDNTELQNQQIEAYRKGLSEDPYVKEIFTNKKVQIGEGDEQFNYPVEPQSLIDVLTDNEKWLGVMYNKEDGLYVPKVETQMLVAAFAQDPKLFLSEYAKHLKSIGSKQVTDPIDNASPAPGTVVSKSEVPPTSMAEAMAKKGRRVDPVI